MSASQIIAVEAVALLSYVLGCFVGHTAAENKWRPRRDRLRALLRRANH